ncbi:cupin domain-containing protein [Streptomyces sp. NPDC002623]
MKSVQFDPAAVETVTYPVDPARVTPGTEIVVGPVWNREDGSEVRGVWQMDPGVLEGVEGDEMFVIVSGRATAEFADGRVWQLGPGDVGIMVPGDVCRWTTHETLRKVFARRI